MALSLLIYHTIGIGQIFFSSFPDTMAHEKGNANS
jgi:hypothetical protein